MDNFTKRFDGCNQFLIAIEKINQMGKFRACTSELNPRILKSLTVISDT